MDPLQEYYRELRNRMGNPGNSSTVWEEAADSRSSSANPAASDERARDASYPYPVYPPYPPYPYPA